VTISSRLQHELAFQLIASTEENSVQVVRQQVAYEGEKQKAKNP
jgi:hypothetical protein